jgi:RNA recognition motif-containing protein
VHVHNSRFDQNLESSLKNLYVGNLSFAANEDQVRSLFEQYGQVERVQLIADRETGQPRGFCFVEMADDRQAESAINSLNGTRAFGRTLSVNEARPRAERSSRFDRGRNHQFGGAYRQAAR